jgi:hypothetical protein
MSGLRPSDFAISTGLPELWEAYRIRDADFLCDFLGRDRTLCVRSRRLGVACNYLAALN